VVPVLWYCRFICRVGDYREIEDKLAPIGFYTLLIHREIQIVMLFTVWIKGRLT
jgi:hypothetical protein